MVGASPTLCCLLIWPFHTGRISKKNNSHPSLSKTGTFFKVPPTHTHTQLWLFLFQFISRIHLNKALLFFDPHPPKKTKNFVRNRTFHEVRIYWIYFSFRPKTRPTTNPRRSPKAFPSQAISTNLPRGESQLGWGWGARSWQWRFGLVCYWDSSLDPSTTKLRVPWQVGRAVLGGFEMGVLDVFFFGWMGFGRVELWEKSVLARSCMYISIDL